MYKNDDVAELWAKGKKAIGNRITSDGNNLYSYRLRIGFTLPDGEKVVINYMGKNRYSMTTSKHTSYAKRYANVIIEPDELPMYEHKALP
jgi:predicted glutamine amidotransferase